MLEPTRLQFDMTSEGMMQNLINRSVGTPPENVTFLTATDKQLASLEPGWPLVIEELISTGMTQMASNQWQSEYPQDCVILGTNSTIPWDNPHNLVERGVERLLDRVKAAILIPALYLVGGPSNLLSMAVFFRQGLKERINMCLFCLACVDFIDLTVMFVFHVERVYIQFLSNERLGPLFIYVINHNVTGLYGFSYTSPLLSAIIATERCVCVLFPLKAQRCVSTKVVAAVIVVSVAVVAFLRFAITAQYRADCFYEVISGRTSWRVNVNEYYERNKAWLILLDGVLYGFCLSIGSRLVVLVTSVITAVKLQQSLNWRNQAANSSSSSSSSSSKDAGVTRMLLCLSAVFLVLSVPVVTLRVWPLLQPQLSAGGLYANTFTTLLGLSELASFVNSSINFFVCYLTGSRYRQTLRAMLHRRQRPGKAKTPPQGDLRQTPATRERATQSRW